MAYEKRQKKKSQFTTDNTIGLTDYWDRIKGGVNVKSDIDALLDKVADVYGMSARVYDTQSELVADDIQVGEIAIVKGNRYAMYSIGNLTASNGDITLTSGYVATQKGKLQKWAIEAYSEFPLIDPAILMDNEKITIVGTSSTLGIRGVFTAIYSVAHGITSTTGDQIKIDDDWYAERIDDKYNIEKFGAVENTDSSVAIRAAITAAAGKPVIIPAKKYIYDEAIISDASVCLVGERMPQLDDLTTPTELIDGSIIIGKMEFTGTKIDISNLGVDRGSANFEDSEDALALAAPAGLDQGLSAKLQNVIGLGYEPTGAFHAVLCEGYRHVQIDNVIGANLYFGIVIKASYGTASNLIGINIGKDGLIVKADSDNGSALDLNISNVGMHMNAAAPDTNAVRVRAQDAGVSAKRINISNITGRFATNCLNIDSANPGLSIDDLNISGVVGDDCVNGILCKGKVNNLTLSDISIVNASGFIADFDTNGVDSPTVVTINNLYGSLTSGSLFIDSAITVGAGVGVTKFDDITLCVERSATVLGAIKYLNAQENNDLGLYRCNLRGSGIPNHGFSEPAITGTAQTITQVHNRRENRSFVKAVFDVGATVSLMDSTIWTSGFGSTKYPEGYQVVIHNNSANTGVINHNPVSEGFFNKGAANVTLLSNECVTYTYSGYLWLES